MIERCHFLFNELRPAIGNEVNSMSRSRLLHSKSRWRVAIDRVIEDIRKEKGEFLQVKHNFINSNCYLLP